MAIRFSPLTRATLHAGGRCVQYVTGGRGAAVLLLHPRPEGEPACRLLGALATRHRVVAPLALDGPACSLGDLFEGLGIERASLVVEAPALGAALAFAAGHDGRVSRVAVLGVRDEHVAAEVACWSELLVTARVWIEADVVHDPAALDELLTYLAASAMP